MLLTLEEISNRFQVSPESLLKQLDEQQTPNEYIEAKWKLATITPIIPKGFSDDEFEIPLNPRFTYLFRPLEYYTAPRGEENDIPNVLAIKSSQYYEMREAVDESYWSTHFKSSSYNSIPTA